MTEGEAREGEEALPSDQQRRGRYLAITSHPFSMLFRVVHLRTTATQALVTLGASEAMVGLQAFLGPFSTLLQLPALGLMGRLGKMRLLLVTQIVAMLFALPLLWFSDLQALGTDRGPMIALLSLAGTAIAIQMGSTAWWPMLHGFVSPGRTSRFFGVLRTGWHVGLILFFLFSTYWLDAHPGGFGLLFLVAWICGFVRCVMLPFFPERNEPKPLRLREAWRMIWRESPMRRHLIGSALDLVVIHMLPPFVIFLLREEIGVSESQTMYLPLAFFFGGLMALYPAGRLSDRFGARPVLIATSVLRCALIGGLAFVVLGTGETVLWGVTGVFLLYSLLTAGFGVAEIKVLFQLAPDDAPSSVIVVVVVIRSVLAALAPLAAGPILQLIQGFGFERLGVYQGFFAVAAGIQLLALVPFVGLRLSSRM